MPPQLKPQQISLPVSPPSCLSCSLSYYPKGLIYTKSGVGKFPLLFIGFCFIGKSSFLTTVPSCLTSKCSISVCNTCNCKSKEMKTYYPLCVEFILFRSSVGFNSTVDEQGHWLKEKKKSNTLKAILSHFLFYCLMS